jgi:ribosome-associated protein
MADPLRVTRSVVVPEKELRWRFSRSSGPGGQSVNTADSRVQLSLDLTTTTALGPVQRGRALERLGDRLVDGVLTVTAQEERSQLRNREIALERLAEILAWAIAPPPRRRRPTRPSRNAVERRIAEKKRRTRIKRLRRVDVEDD